MKKKQVKSLFEQFKLESVLNEIEKAESEKDIKKIIHYSTKLQFLVELMKNLKEEGHRLLIFSMSKKMLNVIQSILESGHLGKIKFMRIDGDTEIAEREHMCNRFNGDPSVFCALLTTKVGGFGLNLTGANRALILDPDWNPANDNQAVDRVFRIGQKRDVIVYRLVTMGGIEEKIYRRQIYKKGMNLATIDAPIEGSESKQESFEKYFKNTDLFELFQFSPETCNLTCETLEMLIKEGCPFEETPTNLKHINGFLKKNVKLVKGITLNSNLYTKMGSDLISETVEEICDEGSVASNSASEQSNKFKYEKSDRDLSSDPSVASAELRYKTSKKPATFFPKKEPQ